MPGQRISQKARMLVMNQVKRVMLPFSFPQGARARKKLTQMRKKMLATTFLWQKIYQQNGCQGKPRDAKVLTATLTFNCPDHSIAGSCSLLPGCWQAQAPQHQGKHHLEMLHWSWGMCSQTVSEDVSSWLLLIPQGGKTTLRVKNTFNTYSVSPALASICVCLCHCAGMGSGIHYKGE